MKATILIGDVLDRLRGLPDCSVQCCVTSPPYWGLRDFGVTGQLGFEATPELYIQRMTEVFAEVRRVLRDDGALWLNIGDSYAPGSKGNSGAIREGDKQGTNAGSLDTRRGESLGPNSNGGTKGFCKPKDLYGIPWMLAFALRADGWWLRQDIIWSKPNPMPESVQDRCTKAHEYLFMLTKSARYYWDAEAIAEPCISGDNGSSYLSARDQATKAGIGTGPRKTKVPGGWDRGKGAHGTIHRDGRISAEYQIAEVSTTRNKRSVWEIATQPYSEAHLATFPEVLVEPCILAGSKPGDTVLDPFCGSGTTGVVALRYHCDFIGIELNPAYAELAQKRIGKEAPMFNEVVVTA